MVNEMGNKNSLSVGEITKIIEWLRNNLIAEIDILGCVEGKTKEEISNKVEELKYLIERLEEQQIQ